MKTTLRKQFWQKAFQPARPPKKFGVPFGNVSRWVRKAKATQAEFLKEAEKLRKSALQGCSACIKKGRRINR